MLLLLKERSFHKVTEEDTNSDNEMEKTKIEVYVEYGNFDDNWNNILDNWLLVHILVYLHDNMISVNKQAQNVSKDKQKRTLHFFNLNTDLRTKNKLPFLIVKTKM